MTFKHILTTTLDSILTVYHSNFLTEKQQRTLPFIDQITINLYLCPNVYRKLYRNIKKINYNDFSIGLPTDKGQNSQLNCSLTDTLIIYSINMLLTKQIHSSNIILTHYSILILYNTSLFKKNLTLKNTHKNPTSTNLARLLFNSTQLRKCLTELNVWLTNDNLLLNIKKRIY